MWNWLKLISTFKGNSFLPYILAYVKYCTVRRVGSVFVCGMTPSACPRGPALLCLSEWQLTLTGACRVKLYIAFRCAKIGVELISTRCFAVFLCWFSLRFCYAMAELELWRFYIFWKINLGQTIGIQKNIFFFVCVLLNQMTTLSVSSSLYRLYNTLLRWDRRSKKAFRCISFIEHKRRRRGQTDF